MPPIPVKPPPLFVIVALNKFAGVAPKLEIPPAPVSAPLPLTVLLIRVNVPRLLMPPPAPRAPLRLTVLLIRVIVPLLKMPPPEAELWPLELLPLTVLLVRVIVPLLKMPPPSVRPRLPLTVLFTRVNVPLLLRCRRRQALESCPRYCRQLLMVIPVRFTVVPTLMVKSPLLKRRLLLPSMIVVEASPPVMVRSPVIVSSFTRVRR